jgi:hypothetical protein
MTIDPCKIKPMVGSLDIGGDVWDTAQDGGNEKMNI